MPTLNAQQLANRRRALCHLTLARNLARESGDTEAVARIRAAITTTSHGIPPAL